jgi:alcohol dehydrogenase class IV
VLKTLLTLTVLDLGVVMYPAKIRHIYFDMLRRPLFLLTPREIVLEVNGLVKIADYLRALGLSKNSKILILVDPILMNLDSIRTLDKSLAESGFHVEWVTEVEYEPSIGSAERLVEIGRRVKPEAVIGIGGGSTLDLAKVMRVGVDNPERSVRDFIGVEKVPGSRTPLILAPSTAGTGSEVSRYSVLRDGERKAVITSRHMVADVALVDPVLTYALPPKVTAGSGLDALGHAVEAMISLMSSPLTDAYALLAIEMVFEYLVRAYLNGRDEEARYFMSMAATVAGIPMSMAGAVYGHSIAMVVGATYKLHHGAAVGMVLPYIMDFYLPVMVDKYNAIANILGITYQVDRYSRALEVVKRVWDLVRELEIPQSLKEIGVSKAELEKLAERTVKELPRPNSPIEMTKERALKIYGNMYEGKLSRVRVS